MGKGEGWGEGQGEGHGEAEAGEWNYGLCSCLTGSCKHLCCGAFCLCCHTCSNANAMGKSGCIYSLLGCILPCIPVLLMRSDLREKHGIDGSTMGDACAACCCTNCASCQIGNEIDSRETESVEMK